MRRKTKSLWIEAGCALSIITLLFLFMLPKFFDAQNINNAKHFPDPFFQAAAEKFMEVLPGETYSAFEAAKKTGKITCREDVIDIRGIEYFKSLTEIDYQRVPPQPSSRIDLSQNLQLKMILISGAQTSELILPHTDTVRELICNQMGLTRLDVSFYPNLEKLACVENRIQSLDLSRNPKLRELFCRHNQLAELDLTHNPLLDTVFCVANPLKKLDTSKNPNLKTLVGFDRQ